MNLILKPNIITAIARFVVVMKGVVIVIGLRMITTMNPSPINFGTKGNNMNVYSLAAKYVDDELSSLKKILKKKEVKMSLEMKYFILKPKSKYFNDPYAKASRDAMETYAKSIRSENPMLAKDLRDWAIKERYDESEKDLKERLNETEPPD